jgi:membrane-associated phospholipid phosphatase
VWGLGALVYLAVSRSTAGLETPRAAAGTSPWASAVSWFADPMPAAALVVSVAAALACARRWSLLAVWVAAVAGNGILTWSLKQLEARDRMPVDSGFGFPSAHASGMAAACAVLAYVGAVCLPPRLRVPAALVAAAVAAAVGASRVVLGMHLLSEAIAGLASGAAWAGLVVFAAEGIRSRRMPLGDR